MDGSCGDDVSRRFFRGVSGFLAERTLTVMSTVVYDGLQSSSLCEPGGDDGDFGLFHWLLTWDCVIP